MIVVSNSGNIGIITFQYYSSKQLQFLLLLFFLLTNSATPLTFNISSFPATDNTISLEGNANIDGQALLLTETEYSAGRASYHQSFLLRENTTRKLADFTTSFTFVIDTLGNNSYYADGLAFFLAPEGSLLNFTVGSGIGFPVDNPQEKPSSSHQYPFVAVEFDIFRNYETSVQDPAGDHVGIDVNSVKSLITKPWNGSVVDAMINNASISYDSGSKNLSIAFTSYVNGSKVMRYLAYKVDLEQYLPERVIVGFCAATGQYFASFKILSWSFNSTSLLEQNAAKNTSIIHVAVKKIARGSKQGLKEYAAEIRIISRLRHRNLVQLIAIFLLNYPPIVMAMDDHACRSDAAKAQFNLVMKKIAAN